MAKQAGRTLFGHPVVEFAFFERNNPDTHGRPVQAGLGNFAEQSASGLPAAFNAFGQAPSETPQSSACR